jgi:hypothetical protein
MPQTRSRLDPGGTQLKTPDYFPSAARLFVVFLNQSQVLVEFIAGR